MHPIEAQRRAVVIAEARTWLGTPFAHRSTVKGAGVDCAQLVRLVFIACGVLPPSVDPGVYASQWHLHRDEERYLAWGHYLAIEVAKPRPADVAIWQFGRVYSHAGIIIDDEHVLHAFEPNHKVTIDPIRMGKLSYLPTVDRSVPRPVKYFDLICAEAYAKRQALSLAPGGEQGASAAPG